MKRPILALDTSQRLRRIAVRCDPLGAVVEARVTDGRPSAAGAIAADLGALLDSGPVGAVVVATGPGSHTGVRAGMAAALGIAQALDIPLHGTGSLEVVAHGAPPEAVAGIAIADAGRGFLYVARFTRRGGGVEVGPARRHRSAEWHPEPAAGVVVSLDLLPIGGLHVAEDRAAALAAAAAAALARPPLPRAGLHPELGVGG